MKNFLQTIRTGINTAFCKRYIQVLMVIFLGGLLTVLHFDLINTPVNLEGLKRPTVHMQYVPLEPTYVQSEPHSLKVEYPTFSGNSSWLSTTVFSTHKK